MEKIIMMAVAAMMGAVGMVGLIASMLGMTIAEMGIGASLGMTVGLAGVMFGSLCISDMNKRHRR